jgi:hypothetical protein
MKAQNNDQLSDATTLYYCFSWASDYDPHGNSSSSKRSRTRRNDDVPPVGDLNK